MVIWDPSVEVDHLVAVIVESVADLGRTRVCGSCLVVAVRVVLGRGCGGRARENWPLRIAKAVAAAKSNSRWVSAAPSGGVIVAWEVSSQ